MSIARITEILETQLGNLGSIAITGTDKTDGTFGAIYTVTETVVAAQVDDGVVNADLTSLTLPAGRWFYGRWSSLTLTSGSIIVYTGME